jgi:hypothetical protein
MDILLQELHPRPKVVSLQVNGDGDRWPTYYPSYGLTGLKGRLIIPFPGPPLRVSPGFDISGFQPDLSGPKACDVIAWAGASPTSGGPGNPSPQIFQAL